MLAEIKDNKRKMKPIRNKREKPRPIEKAMTGIRGLDQITGGGLPKGRPTLVCGGAGSGKTVMAMQFLVNGILQGEPAVFMSFEEPTGDLMTNFSSLGIDLNDLVAKKKMVVEHVFVERSQIEETGEYDLEGLFIRLGYAVRSIGAKRVVLDTIETLFSGLKNTSILRAELRRLFRWLKENELTAVVTGEKGEGTLTRHGLEEYVADCVILLDHRVSGQISTRRLRVVKYRGTSHGADEYPFIIGTDGFSVMPITSLMLDHSVSTKRIATGIPRLDNMLGGEGFYRGSSILISGTAGTGKSSLAATFAASACSQGERCLYLAFEEPSKQIIRNMKSIGVQLEPWIQKGLLRIRAERPSAYGLESHLSHIHQLVEEFDPSVVVVDPITNLISVSGLDNDVRSMLTRLIDYLKSKQITTLFTNLVHGGHHAESTDSAVSSLMDTWVLLRDVEWNGERNRAIYVLKSRGMKHSNQVREFHITNKGIDLLDVYTGPAGVLTGTARAAQEAKDKAEALMRSQDIARKQKEIERKRQILETQITSMKSQFEAEKDELEALIQNERLREKTVEKEIRRMADMRSADEE